MNLEVQALLCPKGCVTALTRQAQTPLTETLPAADPQSLVLPAVSLPAVNPPGDRRSWQLVKLTVTALANVS